MFSEDAAGTPEPGITLRDIFDASTDAYNPWANKDQLLDFLAQYDDGVDMYLFVTKLAELQAEWTATLGGTSHHLLEGHSWLVDRVASQTLEQLEATELVTRPTIYLRGSHESKQQLLRRSYWALGESARTQLDMAAFRGLETPAEDMAADAESRTRKGDPNESLPHAVGVAACTALFDARGFTPRPYHCLDASTIAADYTDRPYDVVVYNEAGEIVGQVEVETRVDDYRGITRDADKLMAAPGESWWCLPTKLHVNRCLQQLIRHDLLQPVDDDNCFPDALSLPRTTKRLANLVSAQKYAQTGVSPPVTGINSFDNIRAKLVDHNPAIMYPSKTTSSH